MSGFEVIIIIVVLLLLFGAGSLLVFKSQRSGDSRQWDEVHRHLAQVEALIARQEAALRDESARNRTESAQATRQSREELASSFKNLSDSILRSMAELATIQKAQLDTFSRQLTDLTQRTEEKFAQLITALEERLTASAEQQTRNARDNREELVLSLQRFAETQKEKLDQLKENQAALTAATEARLEKMRETVELKLQQIQEQNAGKLEEMRATVDEKLQKTLDARLGQSFELVSKQLESVQKGLGEMQTLAQDVGGLKKVLSNVKMRGAIGEVQLEMLLEQILAPEQFESNVKPFAGATETVEFAVCLPGRDEDQEFVYLPLDAKFPQDAYMRYVEATESGDAALIEAASKNLENTLKRMAKDIREKYIHPPQTTDFAILFLPFEGLFAEVVRRSALLELLQREYKVIVTGPTTLAAILNSLQMGFRTLAIQKRSSEVWNILRAVKTEFEKFGGLLQKAKNNLETAAGQLDEVMGRRTRAINRTLRNIQSVPEGEIPPALPPAEADESDDA